MLSFDLDKEEFMKLAGELETPGFVQLLAKTGSKCSPLRLYCRLREAEDNEECNYSYLLESVEKEETRARYSFVGNKPEAMLSIKGKELNLEFLASRDKGFFEELRRGIGKACRLEEEGTEDTEKTESPLKLRASILPGKDGFDALRSAFPTANGIPLLNGKRFSRQTFLGGAIGYTAYDSIYECWLELENHPESDVPDHQFLLISKTFLFDHLTGDVYIVLTPFIGPDSDPETLYEKALSEAEGLYSLLKEAEVLEEEEKKEKEKTGGEKTEEGPGKAQEREVQNLDLPPEEERKAFEAAVLAAKQHIIDGDIFQVVLSRSRTFRTTESPFELYMRLRAINPSPYMYLFEFGKLAIVGASPETLLSVNERTLISNPIAGTCPRGKTEAEDEALAARMLGDEKERAEHVMLVDLGRNDVRMVSKSGSVKVEGFMKVLKYSHVQHIESTVLGELRPECDQFDASRAVFPAGTLSGAPKLRAMEIIAVLENTPRGIYGGGAGYYSWNGDADFAIVIRTLLVKDGLASVQAGAGIVADSVPENEFLETERKMAAMLRAVGAGVREESAKGNEIRSEKSEKSENIINEGTVKGEVL